MERRRLVEREWTLMKDIQNDQDVEHLVYSFYEKVCDGDRLGYIFNKVAQVDWNEHLPQMIPFWSNFLFQTGSTCRFLLRKVISIIGISYLKNC